MSTYRLIDAGYPTFKKIVSGRRWVGRVCRLADGTFLGIIGKTESRARSEREAFDDVVSRHLGFENVDDLRSRNRAVRAHRRVAKQNARFVLDEMMRGNFASLDKMFGFPPKS